MKLERFIARQLGLGARRAGEELSSGSVFVDGVSTTDRGREITRFHSISVRGNDLQIGLERLYLALNKPAGILSATRDPEHPTVLDLVDLPDKDTLHLPGRLDRSSTGLVLLTNDSAWSKRLSLPGSQVEKVYLVETDRPIPERAVALFARGFYFSTEDLLTRPARLEILSERTARVTLTEGRYHQVKRMFHRIDGIRLVSLHRERIGQIVLGEDLAPGKWRRLTEQELAATS